MDLKGNEEKYLKLAGWALAIGICLWYLRKIISNLFGFADEEKRDQEEEDKKRVLDQDREDAIAKTPPSKTLSEWQIIADQIYNDLRYSAIENDEDDATYQICRVKNDADFWILYDKFGKRQRYMFSIPLGAELDLQGFVRYFLDPKQIATINDNYRRKGMKFKF